MKVFTVGLDQKLPKDDDTLSTVTEKNGLLKLIRFMVQIRV